MNKRIHELFENNRKLFGEQAVAYDGVVDEEEYLKSDIKTAFLLKDINGEETVVENGVKKKVLMDKDWEYMEWLKK